MALRNNILAVDTSSRVLSVAVWAGEDRIFEANLEGTPRHSEQLIDLIAEGLKRVGLKKSDLDRFVWGLGPGSFTGLRIGISILKGFSLGFRKRAFGASSLDLIALASGMTHGELAVCVDARRERIYTAIYQLQNGAIRKVLPCSLLSLGELLRKVKRETIFTGDALLTYGSLIQKKMHAPVVFLNPSFWYPRAQFLIHLYQSKHKWLEPLTLRTMRPQYLRYSEAEEKLRRRR